MPFPTRKFSNALSLGECLLFFVGMNIALTMLMSSRRNGKKQASMPRRVAIKVKRGHEKADD
jgi:hypothetical protein